jgi:hypothetical protein
MILETEKAQSPGQDMAEKGAIELRAAERLLKKHAPAGVFFPGPKARPDLPAGFLGDLNDNVSEAIGGHFKVKGDKFFYRIIKPSPWKTYFAVRLTREDVGPPPRELGVTSEVVKGSSAREAAEDIKELWVDFMLECCQGL